MDFEAETIANAEAARERQTRRDKRGLHSVVD